MKIFKTLHNKNVIFGFLTLLFLFVSISTARVPYPVAAAYEDSVRVLVLWNTPLGRGCLGNPLPVGEETKNFIAKSLDTNFVKNVKILKTYNAPSADLDMPAAGYAATTIAQIENLWPGKLPHVIVHSNAGWEGWNGPQLDTILSWAVERYIGIVEVGDDASGISSKVFDLPRVGAYTDMGTATWLNRTGDSLNLKVRPGRDNLIDSSVYPHLNGILKNATLKIKNGDSTFNFKEFVAGGRCEADADDWSTVGNRKALTYLGYQQGYNAAINGTDFKQAVGKIGNNDQYYTLVALQDTITIGNESITRRGVALSFQPQYLKDTLASKQLVYDAIMYSSLAWSLKPVDKVTIRVAADTILAGQSTNVFGDVYYKGAVSPTLSSHVIWNIDTLNRDPNDKLTSDSGATNTFTATKAYRTVNVIGSYFDGNFNTWVRDTAHIYIAPAAPDRITLEDSSKANLWVPRNLDVVTISPSINTSRPIYAFVRDKYNNLIASDSGKATTAVWTFSPTASSSFAKVDITGGVLWNVTVSRVDASSYGVTNVIAMQNGVLKPDTVNVRLDNTTITRIRVLNETTNAVVSTITMNNDSSINLKVVGLPSNATDSSAANWVTVPSNWVLDPALKSDPASPSNQIRWTYNPTNTGNGILTVTDPNTNQKAVVTITITPAPRTLTLKGSQLTAGTNTTITATITDGKGVKRSELSNLTVWQLVANTDPNNRLSGTSGENVGLSATKAYQTITVQATYRDPETGESLVKTIDIVVVAGAADHLSLESSRTPNLTSEANAIDRIFLPQTSNQTQIMYAFLRDRYSNLVVADSGRATQAAWSLTPLSDSTFAKASQVTGIAWQGIVSRANNSYGVTHVVVKQDSLLPDTVEIQLSNVLPIAIRVIDVLADTVVTNVTMATDDTIKFRVEGLPSNCLTDTCWIPVDGIFSVNGVPLESASPSGAVSSWILRPKAAGTGTITVIMQGVDTVLIPLSVTTSPPCRITITLIDKEPIAGIKFRALVQIYNKDTLVAGTFKFDKTASYQDILPSGITFVNKAYSTQDSANILLFGQQTKNLTEWFVNGTDTMEFIIYSPANKTSFHQLIANFKGLDLAFSEKFTVKPGSIDSLEIIDQTMGTKAKAIDTLTAPNGSFYGSLRGYDAFGNTIDRVITGNWQKELGGIPFTNTLSPTIVFQTTTIIDPGTLCITVSADSNANAKAAMCFLVKVAPAVYSAITRDTNGNGYLDRIEVTFSRALAADSLQLSDIIVKALIAGQVSATTLAVTSIIPMAGDTTGKKYIIVLVEPANAENHDLNKPQTSWTPDITIKGYGAVTESSIRALDGAGPVIWKVVNTVDPTSDHSKDKITITYSEPLERSLGSRGTDKPADFYQVWKMEFGKLVKVDTILFTIQSNQTVQATFLTGSTLDGRFTTNRNIFIDESYYFSFKTDSLTMVGEVRKNFPAPNNKAVRVIVEGALATIKSAPNPMTPNAQVLNNPNTSISRNNELLYVLPTDAIDAARTKGISTTIVSFALPTLADSNSLKLSGTFSVYDMVGNLVHRRSSLNIQNLPRSLWANQDLTNQLKQFAINWNGMNDKGTRAAPGAYRLVTRLNLQYKEASNATVLQNKPINLYTITGVTR